MPATCLARQALEASAVSHQQGIMQNESWIAGLSATLERIGCPVGVLGSASLCALNEEEIMSAWRLSYYQSWTNLPEDPRSASSRQIKLATYHQWFAYPIAQHGDSYWVRQK